MPTRTEHAVNPDVGPPATAAPPGQPAVRRRRAIWWYWPPLAILAMAGALVWFSLWSQHIPLGNSLFNHPPLYGKFGPVYTNWTLIRLIPAGLLLAIAAWVAVATGAGARPDGAPPPRARASRGRAAAAGAAAEAEPGGGRAGAIAAEDGPGGRRAGAIVAAEDRLGRGQKAASAAEDGPGRGRAGAIAAAEDRLGRGQEAASAAVEDGPGRGRAAVEDRPGRALDADTVAAVNTGEDQAATDPAAGAAKVAPAAAVTPVADVVAAARASRRTHTVAMLILIIASAWVTSIAVNLLRGDQQSLVKGVSTTQGTYFSRDLHYIDELGVRGFVSSFPSIVDHFVVWNARTHPPGVQVFLWTISKLVHGQPYAMTTVMAILSLCTALGAWGMARAFAGERAGRIAAVLAVAAPGPLMLAYTNMDAVFAAFFAGAAAFLVVGARRRSAVFAAIGGAILGFATFLTYATAFLALAAALAIVVETRSFKQSVKVLGAAILGGAAVLLVLRLTLGFDLLACYAALTRSGAKFVPYWVAGAPAAWLIWSGLPMAALGIAGLIVKVPGARRPVLPALLIVMMIVWGALPPSVTGLRQGEVERTWAFLYPMLAASAGPIIDFWTRGYRPVARAWAGGVVALLVALSVAQAGVVQSLWDNLT